SSFRRSCEAEEEVIKETLWDLARAFRGRGEISLREGVRPDRHWLGSDGQRASIAGSRSLFREKGLRGPLGADTRGDPDVQPIARKEDRALSRDLLKEMLAWVRLKAHPAIRAGETEDAMIHATCHTADNVVCLEFDATPWFNEAAA